MQTLDCFPYGATRISTNVGGADSARKFIGQFADVSSLDYLNARYYDPSRGQFISQDSTFLWTGDPNQVKQVTGREQRELLADPQLANAYSYGRGNPITQKDPNGNIAGAAAIPFLAPEVGLATLLAPEIVIPAAILGTGAFLATEALLRTPNGIKYGGEFDAKRLPPDSLLGPQNILDPFGGGSPNINPKIPKWIIGTVAVGLGAPRYRST